MSCNFCFVTIYLPFLLDDQGDFDSYNIKIYVWNKQQEVSMSRSPFSYYFTSPQPAYTSTKVDFWFFVRKNIAKSCWFLQYNISKNFICSLFSCGYEIRKGRHLTVWKLQDFSVIQKLREINFGHSRSYKTAVLAIFGALNCSEFC